MSKYSLEFKLKVVAYYNRGNSCTATSDKFKVNYFVVNKWVKYFKARGKAGLKVNTNYKKYTLEFKISVLSYMQQHNLSYLNTAIHFNITSPSTIRKWFLKHRQGGILELKTNNDIAIIMENQIDKIKKTDTKKSQKELLKELEYLRAENDYLKKLDALIQKKKMLQKKQK